MSLKDLLRRGGLVLDVVMVIVQACFVVAGVVNGIDGRYAEGAYFIALVIMIDVGEMVKR